MSYNIYYRSDCQDIPLYVCNECPDREFGGVTSVAFLKAGFEFVNPSDATEWLAGIEAGNINFIPLTRGSYDGGTPRYGDGYGRVIKRLLGYDGKLEFMDEGLINNQAFYRAIGSSTLWKVAFFTGTQVWLVDAPVVVAPKSPVSEDIEKIVVWDCEVTWFSKDMAQFYPAPAGVAESCVSPG